MRQQARRIAEEGEHPLILVDGPPGIDCPIIGPDGYDSPSLVDLAGADALSAFFHVPVFLLAGAVIGLKGVLSIIYAGKVGGVA